MKNGIDKTQIMGKRPDTGTMVPLWKAIVAMFVLAFILAFVVALMLLAFFKYERRSDFDAGFQSGKGQAETQWLPDVPGKGK